MTRHSVVCPSLERSFETTYNGYDSSKNTQTVDQKVCSTEFSVTANPLYGFTVLNLFAYVEACNSVQNGSIQSHYFENCLRLYNIN